MKFKINVFGELILLKGLWEIALLMYDTNGNLAYKFWQALSYYSIGTSIM